jgi:hypothetical protein
MDETPVLVRFPWYVGQSGYAEVAVGDGAGAADEDDGGVELDAGGRGDDGPPVHAPRRRAAAMTMGSRIIGSTVDGPGRRR